MMSRITIGSGETLLYNTDDRDKQWYKKTLCLVDQDTPTRPAIRLVQFGDFIGVHTGRWDLGYMGEKREEVGIFTPYKQLSDIPDIVRAKAIRPLIQRLVDISDSYSIYPKANPNADSAPLLLSHEYVILRVGDKGK